MDAGAPPHQKLMKAYRNLWNQDRAESERSIERKIKSFSNCIFIVSLNNVQNAEVCDADIHTADDTKEVCPAHKIFL
jgi:hypothetical protein